MSRRTSVWAPRIGFAALAVAIAAGYAILLRGQFSYGLEYDESYLLHVIANIASGNGFVDDGVAYFTSGEPFHPFISTKTGLPSFVVSVRTGMTSSSSRTSSFVRLMQVNPLMHEL